MSSCDLLTSIIIGVIIIFVLSCVYNYEGYCLAEYSQDEELPSDNLIGLIYPPRAGPLHTNRQFPIKQDCCSRTFTAIYDIPPYIKKY